MAPMLAVLTSLAGCGEAAFSAHTRDNDVGDLQRAMAASAAPAARAGHAMAFLVTDGKLVGYDLADGKIAWEQAADVKSRVIVGGGAIAHRQGERDLVVRGAATGDVRARVTLAADETFVGAALDGDKLVYVVQLADKRSAVVAIDAGGAPLWRRETQSALGAPAARGGLVALPFAHQNLTLLDSTGREIARVRATDEEIAFARALPEGIYYGGARGVYRLDDKSAAGTRAGSSYAEAKLSGEQVRTAYHWDGYQPSQSALGAFDRNRLLWRGREGAGFRDDLAVLHTYRFFFAFDAKAGKLRWVYAHPRTDVVASEDAGGAIVFASADGDIGLIDAASGAVRIVQKTGLRVAGASFDADGLTAGSGATPPSEAEVAKTLEQIVYDHDARFGAVKVFAVDALGDVPGPTVTAALLKLVRAPAGAGGPPPAALARAGEKLVARRDRAAAPAMLEALGEHYDFLDDRTPRGVDVLARALGALGAREAAAPLAAHLLDHETPERALKDLATTLGQLGGPDAVKALRTFLLAYHADPAFLLDPAPLVVAGEALIRAGVEARRAVAFVVEDRRTLQPLARQLRVSLEAADAADEEAAKKKLEKKDSEAAPERQE
ncbi:MAG: Basic proline-rich protein precursor [Myxococcales bacterium]|nr:Basic proline-rich protein precursor [Myxococcales bacterium]